MIDPEHNTLSKIHSIKLICAGAVAVEYVSYGLTSITTKSPFLGTYFFYKRDSSVSIIS
jgi:hypothetical protein